MLANFSLEQSLMKAKSYAKKGKTLEAQKLYETILQNFSNNIRAQQGLASLVKCQQSNAIQSQPQEEVDLLVDLYYQGQFSNVIEKAKGLTEKYPGEFIFWNLLGIANLSLGQSQKATEALKKVTELNPNYAVGFNNLGIALRDQGKLEEAIEIFKKAVLIDPNYPETYNNLGNALQDQGYIDKAIETFKKSISLKPDYALAHYNMGTALKDQGKLEQAVDAFKKSISLKPDNHETYNNMGNALQYQGKLDEAVDAYKKALVAKPNDAVSYNNMGSALQYQGKLEEAILGYKKSISIKSDYAEAHQNLGLAFLVNGRFKEGFNELDWRWKTPKFFSMHRRFSQPLWDGKENLNSKRILIWCEQGVGDTINWSSLLPLITNRAEHCILECQEKLLPLLRRSFPNVEVKPVNRSLDLKRDDFDFHLPMGSLHKHFIPEFPQIAKTDTFLVPDSTRVEYWRERLNYLGKGPYIGISWKSSDMSPERLPNYSFISEWSNILTIPDITFINLQYTDFADDLTKIKKETGVTVHNFDDLDHFDNIDDVAALCTALDMVISNKTTVPFISVGVGTPTKLANWRQSPWNNILNNPVGLSVDIFERDTLEPWENIFQLIKENIVK